MKFLREDSRKDYVQKSKNADNYAPSNQGLGKNRYVRRTHSKVRKSVAQFNKINMDELFKFDLLRIDITVQGETDTYTVTVVMPGVIEYIRNNLRDDEELEAKLVYRAVMSAFNSDDIKVHCTCPDYCLTGENKIKLLSGEHVEIKDLVSRFNEGEDLWVYSTDDNGNFKPGHVNNVWMSGVEKDFIKVTLDNDECITTTPNHKYMLRDGSYCEAQNLHVGQSLMPLYFKEINGYEQVKKNYPSYPTLYESTYKLVANELLQEQIEEAKLRSGEDVISIHHINFDKSNNTPCNLYPMGHQEHYLWHSNHVKETGQLEKFVEAGREYWEQPDARERQRKVMSNVLHAYYNTRSDDERLRRAEQQSTITKQSWENGCFDTDAFHEAALQRGKDMHTPEREQLSKDGVQKYWDNLSDEEQQRRAEISRENVKHAHNAVKGVPKSDDTKRKMSAKAMGRHHGVGKVWWTNGFESIRSYECPGDGWVRGRKIKDFNHKIKCIEYVHYEEPVPIYDISVDEYNNFLVSSGVILHNCYRIHYWNSQKGLEAGDRQDDPGKGIVNPNDTKGTGCKHVLLVLSNNSWVIKASSVIRNYINYMAKHEERLYKEVIYPAIHGHEYDGDDGIQMELVPNDNGDIIVDTSKELAADETKLDTANKWAKTKNQFKKGNQSGVQFTKKNDDGQLAFTTDKPKLFNYDDLISDS